MDELQRGANREFIFINQATNKIRFNSLESVAEDDQHGKNIVLLNRSLRRLSPEEFREAKHFLAKFFHTVQYILNTEGGFTGIEHKQLNDRLLGLSILMGYGIKRNAQLLGTIIHYAQHNRTHGEHKKFNYFWCTTYTTSLSNIIAELDLLKTDELFPILQNIKLGLEFELAEDIIDEEPALKKLIKKIGSISDQETKRHLAYNMLTLANNIVFLLRRKQELSPIDRFYIASHLVLSLAEIEQEKLYEVYSKEEIIEMLNTLLELADSKDYAKSEYLHIVNPTPPLAMECFINEICQLVPDLDDKRFERYNQTELERVSLLLIAASHLSKKDIDVIGFYNLPYRLQVYWRSCAIVAHGVNVEDMFGKYLPVDSQDFTIKQSMIIKKALQKKRIDIENMDNLMRAIQVFVKARDMEQSTYENVERFIRKGSMSGEVAGKYEIFESDKDNTKGSFSPSAYLQMFIENVEFATKM